MIVGGVKIKQQKPLKSLLFVVMKRFNFFSRFAHKFANSVETK